MFVRLILLFSALSFSPVSLAQDNHQKATDPVSDSLLPTSRMISPAGESVAFHWRPVDLELHGKYLFAKDRSALQVIDAEKFNLLQTIDSPGGASMYGLAVGASGNVYFTNSENGLHVYRPTDDAEKPYAMDRTIELPADCYPCGVFVSRNETEAVVCLSKLNSIAIVDLATGNIKRQVKVGVAPFDIQLHPESGHYYVSNIGGRLPQSEDLTAPSAGTPTVVDKRGVASTGSISVVDLAAEQPLVTTHTVGRHPTTLTWIDGQMCVCNTNDDSISLLGGGEIVTTDVKPDAELPFGSMPSEIGFDPSANLRFVALAGNNAVAVTQQNNGPINGLIPTGWYPRRSGRQRSTPVRCQRQRAR